MLKDTNQIVGTATPKAIEAGIGEENKELREKIQAEIGIDLEKDNLYVRFQKVMNWLDSDSELVNEFIARSVEERAKNLVDVKEVAFGKND